MEPNERNETGTPKGQATPTEPSWQCCGGDFAAFGSEGGAACSPSRFMAGMARPTTKDTAATASCPMAKMCEGMMKGGARGLGLLLLIPAAVLLMLGAVILLVPKILTWLVAGGLAVLLLGCSTEPYQIETTTHPPWEMMSKQELPALDPDRSGRHWCRRDRQRRRCYPSPLLLRPRPAPDSAPVWCRRSKTPGY